MIIRRARVPRLPQSRAPPPLQRESNPSGSGGAGVPVAAPRGDDEAPREAEGDAVASVERLVVSTRESVRV
jgi:hypothetical protein